MKRFAQSCRFQWEYSLDSRYKGNLAHVMMPDYQDRAEKWQNCQIKAMLKLIRNGLIAHCVGQSINVIKFGSWAQLVQLVKWLWTKNPSSFFQKAHDRAFLTIASQPTRASNYGEYGAPILVMTLGNFDRHWRATENFLNASG